MKSYYIDKEDLIHLGERELEWTKIISLYAVLTSTNQMRLFKRKGYDMEALYATKKFE